MLANPSVHPRKLGGFALGSLMKTLGFRRTPGLSDREECAIVIDELIPENVASQEWKPVRDAVAVHDRAALKSVIAMPITEITSTVE